MNTIIKKLFLQKYNDLDSQTYKQALSLTLVHISLAFLMILLSFIIIVPTDKIKVLGVAVIDIIFLFCIRFGYQRIIGILTSVVLSLAIALIIFTTPVLSYLDVYQLAFLEIMVLFVTLLITTETLHVYLAMSISIGAIINNYFFRALPANLGGEAPDIDDQFITILFILFAGFIVATSNKRGKKLLKEINEENIENIERAKRLRSIIEEFHEGLNTGDELVDSAEKVSKVTEELQIMVGEIRNQMNTLTATSSNLTSASISIADSSLLVTKESENQSAIIEESSAAITEMASSIESISKIAEDRKNTVSELSQSAEKAETVLDDSTEAIKNLKELISSLGDVNMVISNISTQTGLLAMNAAIEAAHAGESGKGFSVVADEVRKLSENTGENVKNIAQMLLEVNQSIDIAAQTNVVVINSFDTIKKDIGSVVTGMDEILSGVAELSVGTKEINSGTAQSVSSSSEVKIGISAVNERIQQITADLDKQKDGSLSTLKSVESAFEKLSRVQIISHRIKEVGQINASNLKIISDKLAKTE